MAASICRNFNPHARVWDGAAGLDLERPARANALGELVGYSLTRSAAQPLRGERAPSAVQRSIKLTELDRIDERGKFIPLSELPDADRRVIAAACNGLLDRAFGKPKEPPTDPEQDSSNIEHRIDWRSQRAAKADGSRA